MVEIGLGHTVASVILIYNKFSKANQQTSHRVSFHFGYLRHPCRGEKLALRLLRSTEQGITA